MGVYAVVQAVLTPSAFNFTEAGTQSVDITLPVGVNLADYSAALSSISYADGLRDDVSWNSAWQSKFAIEAAPQLNYDSEAGFSWSVYVEANGTPDQTIATAYLYFVTPLPILYTVST